MVRARDHGTVTEQTRREGRRLLKAWREYDRAKARLAGIVQCPDRDRDLLVQCDLLEGHPPGQDNGGHRHRVKGTQGVVTW